MNILSVKVSNTFVVVKSVFVNTSIALEMLMIFIKRANLRHKITGYLQNLYQMLFSLLFFLVKTTKIYIKGVCLVYDFKDSSKKLQRTSFLCLELTEDETEISLSSNIWK